MNKSIWEWLEIEPTGEISEIRAAYARQVKKYHPEDTPEEFEHTFFRIYPELVCI